MNSARDSSIAHGIFALVRSLDRRPPAEGRDGNSRGFPDWRRRSSRVLPIDVPQDV